MLDSNKNTNFFNTKIVEYNDYVLHGSDVIVDCPRVEHGEYTKDFGEGFYTTKIQTQAETWAVRKQRDLSKHGVVSIFDLNSDYSDLKYKYFPRMTEEWLDFIVECRLGKSHNYDLVEGPMADDTIYSTVGEFMNGAITREEFWILVKFNYPTHQLCFNSDKALKHLRFQACYEVR